MGWGDILTTIGTAINPTLGAAIGFGNNLINAKDDASKAKQASNSYYEAIAKQQALGKMSAEVALQRANFEKAMRDRLLSQTGAQGAALRQAQLNMGAMPQFNEGRVTQDYQNTKATMMNDFQSMLRLVESQGRASQFERLGGAGSMSADDARMNALIKQYSGELQKIDDAAYDSALNRASNTMNLYNTNRQNTLREIQDVFQPQITNETALMRDLDTTGLSSTAGSITNQLETNATRAGNNEAGNQAKIDDSLNALLARVFNNRDPIKKDDIIWRTPGIAG